LAWQKANICCSSHNGIDYSLSIFVADTSSLKHRAFALGVFASPNIATSWLRGPIATAFLHGPCWRWAYGAFSIITPVIAAPLLLVFVHNYRKAKAAGLIRVEKSNRSLLQSFTYYAVQLDILGIVLVSAGLALFLLAFGLDSYQPKGWQSPSIICMFTFGVLLTISFVLYEKYLAPVTFVPHRLLSDRTVIGAFSMATSLFTCYFVWESYFGSFLQVVSGLSIINTSYFFSIFSVGAPVVSLVAGLLIGHTGRFKWLALYFACPLIILGSGLMILFRRPGIKIGYIIMCQVFMAIAGGALSITGNVAVMAAVSHQHVAVILAMFGMFSYIGAAVGSTIAAAIRTSVFPEALLRFLPEEYKKDYRSIYASLTKQLSYPTGTPARYGIQLAYAESQKYMLIAATALQLVSLLGVLAWRDITVKDIKQVKGLVL
jgi:MFS family permease